MRISEGGAEHETFYASPATCLVFSHCGRWLAAGGYGGGLHVWDTANPAANPLHPDPLHLHATRALGFRADDHSGRVYEHKWVDLREAQALAFRADGSLFVHDGTRNCFLFAPAAGTLTDLGELRIRHLVAAPDGRRVVRVFAKSPIGTWTIPAAGKPAAELSVRCAGAEIRQAAFAPDGTRFATAERYTDANMVPSSKVTVCATATGKPVCSWEFPGVLTPLICFANGGTHLIARTLVSLACWNLGEPGSAPRKGVNPGRKRFVAMAAHPAGPLLTVANDRVVRVWDVPALTAGRSFTWNIGKLNAVTVSPDGTRAAVGSDTGTVLVWDWD